MNSEKPLAKEEESRKKLGIAIVVASMLVLLILHGNSILSSHKEGDEIVYLTLAREMNWDLSHYTTQDDPKVSGFPYTIYQGPVFHHPPLFPWLLKLFGLAGNPMVPGLVFLLLVHVAVIGFCWYFVHAEGLSWSLAIGTTALLAGCPFLLVTTTKLHLDGLASVLGFVGIMLVCLALTRRSNTAGVLGGVLIGLSLNSRYSSLLYCAVFPLMAIALWVGKDKLLRSMERKELMRCAMPLILAALIALILGAHHYVRVYHAYGTIFPSQFYHGIPDRMNTFLRQVEGRSRLQVIVFLLSVCPLFALFVVPAYWKRAWTLLRQGKVWAACYWCGPLLTLLCFGFQYVLLRYFAIVAPFLYLSSVDLLLHAKDQGKFTRYLVLGLFGLTGFCIVGACYMIFVHYPGSSLIVPIFFLLDGYRSFYLGG